MCVAAIARDTVMLYTLAVGLDCFKGSLVAGGVQWEECMSSTMAFANLGAVQTLRAEVEVGAIQALVTDTGDRPVAPIAEDVGMGHSGGLWLDVEDNGCRN